MSDKYKENFDSDTLTEQETSKPSLYLVILLNDHYTTMEFVVFILENIFNKSKVEAEQIMLSVHNNGSGIAGTYIKEVAETKVYEVHKLAYQNEFPLKCKLIKA